MEPQDEWIFFKDIDWNCPKNNRFNVDTRDFHVGYTFEKEPHRDWSTISRYDHFFFTETQLKELISRLFEESGGPGEWRLIGLVSTDERVKNWRLKYLRIWRTDLGFIVCNSDNIAILKTILESKVDQRYLNHH